MQCEFSNDVKYFFSGLCETFAPSRDIVSRQKRKGFAEDAKVVVLLCGLSEIEDSR